HRTARPKRLWPKTRPAGPPRTGPVGRASPSSSKRPSLSARSSAGSSNRNSFHPQRRLPNADRDARAGLAAGTDSRVPCRVVAYHSDAMEIGRAVANQPGALQRCAKFAVFDFVGLGALEDILAGGDVDLTTAEIGGIDPVLHGCDNFGRIACAR